MFMDCLLCLITLNVALRTEAKAVAFVPLGPHRCLYSHHLLQSNSRKGLSSYGRVFDLLGVLSEAPRTVFVARPLAKPTTFDLYLR